MSGERSSKERLSELRKVLSDCYVFVCASDRSPTLLQRIEDALQHLQLPDEKSALRDPNEAHDAITPDIGYTPHEHEWTDHAYCVICKAPYDGSEVEDRPNPERSGSTPLPDYDAPGINDDPMAAERAVYLQRPNVPRPGFCPHCKMALTVCAMLDPPCPPP